MTALAASTLAEEQARQIARAAEEEDAVLIYRDYRSVFDLVESTIDKPERLNLGSLGSLSWVGLGDSTYMIDLKGIGRLQISVLPESEPRACDHNPNILLVTILSSKLTHCG